MKKLLSVLLSFIMVFSFATPVYASVEKANSSQISSVSTSVSNDIKGEVKFLGIKPSVAASVDAYTLFRADTSDVKAYLAELDENLSKNEGKVLVGENEDIIVYAAIINILNIIGENPANYKGYDIKAAFEATSQTQAVSNPYYYRVVVEACKAIKNDKLAHQFIDELIKENYTMGSGMYYWGFSCDNTAVFLTSIAPYASDYSEYVEDAKNVIKTYTTPSGCFYSTEYTDISADSTAVAMMAYSAIGDYDTAYFLYNALMAGFESKTNDGVIFAYGEENAYATKEALLALTYFNAQKLTHDYDVQYSPAPTCAKKGTKISTCNVCGDVKVETVNALGAKYHKPYISKKAKSATYFAAGSTAEYKCEECGAVVQKAKAVAKKGVTISKASSSKGKLNISYKKISGVKGYQVCFSKSKDFSTKKIIKTNGTSCKISGLKKNKTYYVKVRAFKVVKGKTIYTGWSKVKAIKVK